ncbi:MAG: hypothetical protein EAZ36_07710 [Verrucomicrobia bacterium]|nr:MAG: hypothetical protein EAZ36_07710 [Verrucomicrobiota bacterium]
MPGGFAHRAPAAREGFSEETGAHAMSATRTLAQRRPRSAPRRHEPQTTRAPKAPKTKTARASPGVFKANNIPYAFALLAPAGRGPKMDEEQKFSASLTVAG